MKLFLRMILGLSWVAVVAACGGGNKSFDLAVEFPDEASRAATANVRIYDIIPSGEAACEFLMDGTAVPGDGGYAIEDQILISLPEAAGARPLNVPEEGRRLFFAEARDGDDQIILRGCRDFVAGSSDGEIVISLEPAGPVCETDADCDDDNPCTIDTCNEDGECVYADEADGTSCADDLWCNGDEVCQAGICQPGSRDCSDDDPCTQDLCDEALDQCRNPPVTEPPDTEGPVGDPSCSDGVDNDCDGLTDEEDPACRSCQNNNDCDDNQACTTDECVDGACQNTAVEDGTACDDGLFCTEGDSCTAGRCVGTARDCSQLDDSCNLGVCNEESEACEPAPLTAGTDCEDGFFCTDGDACDGSGNCVGGASPCTGECEAGCDEDADACLPAAPGTPCTDNGLFCDGVEVCDAAGACVSPGDPCGSGDCAACDEGNDSCTVDAGALCDDGVACTTGDVCLDSGACVGTPDDGQCGSGEICRPECFSAASGCGAAPSLSLSCESPLSLSVDGDVSACTLTASGADVSALDACLSCSSSLGLTVVAAADFDDGACGLDGWTFVSGNNCKAKKANDCVFTGGPMACCDELATICDTATYGQPVLAADLDVACGGLRQFRLVGGFDFSGLTNPTVCYDVATIGAISPTGFMLYADAGTGTGPLLDCIDGSAPSDGAFYRRCVDLSAVLVNERVDLDFVLDSGVSGHRVFLDNIVVFGYAGGCAPNAVEAFNETFSGCDLSAWSADAGIACTAGGCSLAGTESAVAGSGTLSTVVDASALDGDVQVCFVAGQMALDAGDSLSLWFDAGAGPVSAWGWSGSVTAAGDCQEFCADLSAVDPQVRNHPALEIGFDMSSASSLALYRVVVKGSSHCASTGEITLGGLSGNGSGSYGFDATNAAGTQLDTLIQCQFDPAPAEPASAHVLFTP